MSKDIYGFPSARRSTLDKLKKIEPSAGPPRSNLTDLEKADAAGAALGFVPREIARPATLRKRKEVGPTIAINMRVPEAIAARFITYCEERRMSYWEGVEELMRQCGVP